MMTLERAIEILNPEHREHYDSLETVEEACKMGMEALKKQIPKKPRLNDSDYAYFECDSCGTAIAYSFEPEEHKYCLHCGQALDWGLEDESTK